MKKYIFCFCLFLLSVLSTTAQDEYKIAVNSGTLKIMEVNKVDFEGHDGSEIIIHTEAKEKKENKRAEGLRAINGLGRVDNTGIGLNVEQKDGEVIVSQISRKKSRMYKVLVPKGVSIYYEHSNYDGGKVHFQNLSNEIEVSANYNSILLEEVTGPMAIHTVYGKIEGHFGRVNQEGSISLHSVYGLVDVALPGSTKATVRLSSPYGEMFTDLDLAVDQGSDMRNLSKSKVKGKLNGGGVDFNVKATYANIYLRKRN